MRFFSCANSFDDDKRRGCPDRNRARISGAAGMERGAVFSSAPVNQMNGKNMKQRNNTIPRPEPLRGRINTRRSMFGSKQRLQIFASENLFAPDSRMLSAKFKDDEPSAGK